MNLKGHRRGYQSLSSDGADRVQRGGTVTCSCGWHGSARSREDGAELHTAHKADVAAGRYDDAVEAERTRRLAMYDALLADDSKFGGRGLTREQVEEWRSDLLAGRTVVAV